jgi:predicted GH43/DUF377 family glycosyl hydrolase
MRTNYPWSRRQLIQFIAAGAASPTLASVAHALDMPAVAGWEKYKGNPVLGGQYGTCFDVCLLYENDVYRMWVSWRPKKSVAIVESKDGISWSAPEIVLPPETSTGWEEDINRPIVVHRDDGYHMWYTGQANGMSKIGYAKSKDGRTWTRQSDKPVLEASVPWEKGATMCPHVLWDSRAHLWKMWYSAGEQYEPNAIGYATSTDGLHWEKSTANPVLAPNQKYEWEQQRVAAAQILFWKGWYYAFYIGFRDIDHAQVGLARSKDGVTNWKRHAGNPIIRPTPGGWDADACYKPFAVHSNGMWRVWYNGRSEHLEQIGLILRHSDNLGFVVAP